MKASDWISVEDRLPKIGKRVIVCQSFNDGSSFTRMATRVQINQCDRWYDDEGFEIEYITHWQPIELTKEFFEKNGFILLESLDYYDNYFTSEDMRIDVYESSNGWVVHIDNIEFSTAFCKCLKYVHELQNAYYVSTGEEMEIKL